MFWKTQKSDPTNLRSNMTNLIETSGSQTLGGVRMARKAELYPGTADGGGLSGTDKLRDRQPSGLRCGRWFRHRFPHH